MAFILIIFLIDEKRVANFKKKIKSLGLNIDYISFFDKGLFDKSVVVIDRTNKKIFAGKTDVSGTTKNGTVLDFNEISNVESNVESNVKIKDNTTNISSTYHININTNIFELPQITIYCKSDKGKCNMTYQKLRTALGY